MTCSDFEYNGIKLSELGYRICSFDQNSDNTSGSALTFNTVSNASGSRFYLVNSAYQECLEITFSICKNTCGSNEREISLREYAELLRWLNRKKFYKLRLLSDEYVDIFFEGSFNISKREASGKIIGLDLTFFSNRPFGMYENKKLIFEAEAANSSFVFYDVSEEIGSIYPHMEIAIAADGDLTIKNSQYDEAMVIHNCIQGEVISLDYPMISSSSAAHAETLANDFNWSFFKISNTFRNRKNELTVSLPCTIKIVYSPVAKIGI